MFRTLPIKNSSTAQIVNHPFKVYVVSSNSNGATVWKRGVSYDSLLFKSIVHTDTQEITGLLTKSNPASTDAGWVETQNDDIIWLELAFSTKTWPTIISASIKSKKIDGEFPCEVQHDGGIGTSPKVYTQTKARIVLATVSINNSIVTVNQIVKSNLRMALSPMSGKANKQDNSPVIVAANYPYNI